MDTIGMHARLTCLEICHIIMKNQSEVIMLLEPNSNDNKDSISKSLEPDTLMNKIEKAYSDLFPSARWSSVREVLASDENSADFIRWVLKDEDYREVDSSNPMYEFAKGRSRHSVITFFIGLVFINCFGFFENIKTAFGFESKPGMVIHLWMLTSLYHDWAYYSTDLGKPDLDYRRITTYYLLEDAVEPNINDLSILFDYARTHSETLAYTYKEIEAYDVYARKFLHPRFPGDHELLDHGILGGVKIFDRLVRRQVKRRKDDEDYSSKEYEQDLLNAKASCLTIAQHNIFKSSSTSDDVKYGPELTKLHSPSNFVISINTPLLLLMSLVDTFECVKVFGKSNNVHGSLRASTVLGKISVIVNLDSVIADFSKLAEYINNNLALIDKLDHHIGQVCDLNKWTAFTAIKEGKNTVRITMRSNIDN